MGLFWSPKLSFAQKPRVVVMTDISYDEPDDKQSLVRFLLYANEFEVEGLIATTSIAGKNLRGPEYGKYLTGTNTARRLNCTICPKIP